jgi:hypothetical protein
VLVVVDLGIEEIGAVAQLVVVQGAVVVLHVLVVVIVDAFL